MAVSRMRSKKYAILRLFVAESQNSRSVKEIGDEEHDGDVTILDQKWKYGGFAHAQ